jgi:DNA-binding transcriptional MerR regulator
MQAATASIDIPNRALFKASEVCDLVHVQPYVLRTWEAEFPNLGVSKSAGAPRVYRRSDVEQVLRIKHLLLVEGLTLAGARRQLVEESAPVAADAPVIDELIGQNARERLTAVKRGLRSILEMLGLPSGEAARAVAAAAARSAAAPVSRTRTSSIAAARRSKRQRRKPSAGRKARRR